MSKWKFNKKLLKSNIFARRLSLIHEPDISKNQIKQMNEENFELDINDFYNYFRIVTGEEEEIQGNSGRFNFLNYRGNNW